MRFFKRKESGVNSGKEKKEELTPKEEAIKILKEISGEKDEYHEEMIKLVQAEDFSSSNEKTGNRSPIKHFEGSLRTLSDYLKNLEGKENPDKKRIDSHKKKIEKLEKILKFMKSEEEK